MVHDGTIQALWPDYRFECGERCRRPQERRMAEGIRDDPCVYSSEIQIDETAQPQVYFFTRYFGKTHGEAESWKRNVEVRQVLQAMRGGDQPIGFLYGNDLFAHPALRGQISCWHSA